MKRVTLFSAPWPFDRYTVSLVHTRPIPPYRPLSFSELRSHHYRNAMFQRATATDVRGQMSYSTSYNYHFRNSSARKLHRENIDVRLFKSDRKITRISISIRRRNKIRMKKKKNRFDRDDLEHILRDIAESNIRDAMLFARFTNRFTNK